VYLTVFKSGENKGTANDFTTWAFETQSASRLLKECKPKLPNSFAPNSQLGPIQNSTV